MPEGALPQVSGVRTALRDGTDAAHQRMHHLEPFRAIANGTFTAERYPPLLKSLLMFHSTVGAAVERHGWARLSSARKRIKLLRSDLRGFGRGRDFCEVGGWMSQSRHEALGALYATEGSIFGGRVIGRQLDYLFGDTHVGRRFFIGSPSDGSRWRQLLAAIEEYCVDAEGLDQAIKGAISAFDLFERCVMARPVDPSQLSISGPAPNLHTDHPCARLQQTER